MITLRYLTDSPCQTSAYKYRVGTAVVAANQSIPILAPYAITLQHLEPVELPDQSMPRYFENDQETLIYQGQVWLARGWRDVSAWRTPAGFVLDAGGIGRFAVSADGKQILELSANRSASKNERDEVVLGPVLLLALALQGQWALHASAVIQSGVAIAFIGESGAGKSTLARYLHNHNEQHHIRIADDILLVELRNTGIDALSYYPQLKLQTDQWPSSDLPERIELRGAYIVNNDRTNATTVSITPLNSRQACLALMRHTVAARLFSGDLLEKHVRFSAVVANTLPVQLLTYPLDLNMQAKVREMILADSSSLSAY